MKKYKIGDYSILANMPHSFQISSKDNSYRLVEHDDNPEALYPLPITIDDGYINENNMLLYTPRKYMRLVFYPAESEYDESNGQIDVGIRTPEAEMDFVSWMTLANGIPMEVIHLAYKVLTNPDAAKPYLVPLYPMNNNNNNNNTPPTPPPQEKPKKKMVFKVDPKVLEEDKPEKVIRIKVAKPGGKTQRRFRRV